MTDSLKLHSVPSESENWACPVEVAECMQDGLSSDVPNGATSFPEGPPISNGPANAHALRNTYSAQDLRSVNSLSTPGPDSSPMNLDSWDSCRCPSLRCMSTTSLQNHTDYHSFMRNVPSQSTLTDTHNSLAQSTIDHLPFSHVIKSSRSIPSLSFSDLSRPVPMVGQIATAASDDNVLSVSVPSIRHMDPHSSHPHGLSTPLDCFPSSDPELDGSAFTSHAVIERRVPITFNSRDNIQDRGSISDPEYGSGTGPTLRRARRRHEALVRQHSTPDLDATAGAARAWIPTSLTSRSPVLHVPDGSQVPNLPVSSATFLPSEDEDCDNLPTLLSLSDGSESDCPLSAQTSPDTDTDSQSVSEDARSRFLNPGTPIQTELPELHSLLELFPPGGDTRRLWVGSETNALPDSGGFQTSQEDEDIIGDAQRAKELLDGLEQVNSALVRRYEKVRGDGHDICTVCRDALLPSEEKNNEDLELSPNHVADWNIFASTALPFRPPSWEPEIHAFPCTHLFHTNCLIPWLSLKTTCPTCRLDIDPHSLTLRVREWTQSSWPHTEHREPQYVNVDVLGRRIPWQRPRTASLEEWVEQRENETPEQRERRQKLCVSPSYHSEPPDCSESIYQTRRRTLSEPLTTDMCGHQNVLNLVVRASSALRDSAAGRFSPRARSYSVTGLRWEGPDAELEHVAARMLLQDSPYHGRRGPDDGDLQEPLYRRSYVSLDTISRTTTNAATSDPPRSPPVSAGMSSDPINPSVGHTTSATASALTVQTEPVPSLRRLQ